MHSAAGPKLAQECSLHYRCLPGDVKLTNGYELPCRKVIHTVGPKYDILARNGDYGIQVAETVLASCYQRALQLAADQVLHSIAFCAIATGAFGYPGARAAGVALREVKQFLARPSMAEKFDRIIFCAWREVDEMYYRRIAP